MTEAEHESTMQPEKSPPPPPVNNDHRRTFLAALATLVSGAVTLLTPLAAGVATFLSPLFRRANSPLVRVALLSQVHDDGLPRSFAIATDRTDAWTRFPSQKVGSVYLVRQPGDAQPRALTAKCPHAGCFIGYTPGDDRFRCPCHTSSFNLDGTRAQGNAEVSPRDMDSLPVELRTVKTGEGTQVTEVWVEFIDFQTGHKEAIPTA